jgi:DNA (cytosine-5)-methyltransferase 1
MLIIRAISQRSKLLDRNSDTKEKTFAEFFAGIGLMRIGLERQGWSIRFANDIEPDKYAMYKGHFSDADDHFVLDDIHKLDCADVPTVKLATASFPCNDLSLAGAREGLGGKQSSAFWGFIRIVKEMEERRPPIILLENVLGFLTSHQGKDFEQALTALNNLGYTVDAFVLDASHFTPQSRVRLFVVAVLENNIFIKDPPPVHSVHFFQSEVRPKALADFIFTHNKIKWRLRDLPAPPQIICKIEDVIEDLPETAAEWWPPKRSEYLLNQMSPRHRKIAEEMIAGEEWSYGTVFRRIRNGKSMGELRTDGVAGCLRTPRGGSGRQILFKGGGGKYFARLITPREAARLMGADDYNITVPLNQALFGFGDAVCVPVIEWIAQHYLNPLVESFAIKTLSSVGEWPVHTPTSSAAILKAEIAHG